MIQHLILLLAAPSLIVAGGSWQPLLIGPALRLAPPVFKAIVHERWGAPLRVLGHTLAWPLVAVGAFNVVMVGWADPGPFNLSETKAARCTR